VATMANNLDLHDCHLCKDCTVTDADLARGKIRDVMATVDFIDTVEAAFFDHRLGATRTLLCRLKQKSDTLVAWNLVAILSHYLCTSE